MSLKQSSKDSSAVHGSSSTFECWRRERDRACLRVEIRPDETFVFPYQQFFGAHHVRAGVETLKITFSTHEITLSGDGMEELLAALQEFAVDWIRPMPGRYRNLGQNREPLITAIEVKALSE